MAARQPEPSDEDGPLFRAAYRHADDVDSAEQPAARRKAWARFLPSAAAALGEGFLRDELMVGAVLFSVIVAVIGATSGDPAWAAACVVSGVTGMVLVGCAKWRRWSFGRQWAVILGVLVIQAAVLVIFWRTR